MIQAAASLPSASHPQTAVRSAADAAQAAETGGFAALLALPGAAPDGAAADPAGAASLLLAAADGSPGKPAGKTLPVAASGDAAEASETDDNDLRNSLLDPAGVPIVLAGLLLLPAAPAAPDGAPQQADPSTTAAAPARQHPATAPQGPVPVAVPVALPVAPALTHIKLASIEVVAQSPADQAAAAQQQAAATQVARTTPASTTEMLQRSAAEPALAAATGHDRELLPRPTSRPRAVEATAAPLLAPATDGAMLRAATPGIAAAPAAPAAPVEAPQDFAALVGRLTEAREAASPHLVRTVIAHAEFGLVSLQFRHDDGAMAVTMANSDPAFTGSVQAAAASLAAGNDQSQGQQPQHQSPSFGAPQGQQGSGAGQNPQSRPEQAGQSHFHDQGAAPRSDDGEAPAQHRERTAARRGDGVYA